eukprot:TRINITY_DN21175_c0_g1_i1.p1 TRINITY_DN21175_c0_g1~~TRINITY_DN21175_c0_g1_i1.p1  ORF type:complete len:714 (+),score=87.55 TRINITY_DN21175_c0_g1_i1:209-2350(+)
MQAQAPPWSFSHSFSTLGQAVLRDPSGRSYYAFLVIRDIVRNTSLDAVSEKTPCTSARYSSAPNWLQNRTFNSARGHPSVTCSPVAYLSSRKANSLLRSFPGEQAIFCEKTLQRQTTGQNVTRANVRNEHTISIRNNNVQNRSTACKVAFGYTSRRSTGWNNIESLSTGCELQVVSRERRRGSICVTDATEDWRLTAVSKEETPIMAATSGAATAFKDSSSGPVLSSGAVGEIGTAGPILDHLAASRLVDDALTWAALHGLVVGDSRIEGSGEHPGTGIVHAPISLLPTPFPRALFDHAYSLAPYFNELADAVSEDGEFLQSTLKRAAKSDSFTAGLLDTHSKLMQDGISQNIRLGLHRSDYMLDVATNSLLQIELNTISSSFPGLGTQVALMHRYLIDRMDPPEDGSKGPQLDSVPENPAREQMVEGLATAWKEYGDDRAVVLMVVQPGERNQYDQHWLSYELWATHRVKCVRRTLAEIESTGTIGSNGTLMIGEQAVSVVYFRAGYGPADYPSEKEWAARLLVERSSAVKCPSVAYQLAGAKKVQQEVARAGVLERFISDPKAAAALRSSFAGLWSLEGEDAEPVIASAIANPHVYVMKPQREGGGNNIYGEEVRHKLEVLRAQEGGEGLAAFILMQRIFPPTHSSYLLRNGGMIEEETLSELGIYSTYLRHGEKVILNQAAGHLLRTKTAKSDEGGVAAGFAVLDSPYLV